MAMVLRGSVPTEIAAGLVHQWAWLIMHIASILINYYLHRCMNPEWGTNTRTPSQSQHMVWSQENLFRQVCLRVWLCESIRAWERARTSQ